MVGYQGRVALGGPVEWPRRGVLSENQGVKAIVVGAVGGVDYPLHWRFEQN